jgi:hypothetical protein
LRADGEIMSERATGAYVLSLHLGGSYITRDEANRALRELAFLDAAPAPSAPGAFAFHCLVTAVSRADAIAYIARRAITALIAAGVDAPTVEGVDISVLEGELV